MDATIGLEGVVPEPEPLEEILLSVGAGEAQNLTVKRDNPAGFGVLTTTPGENLVPAWNEAA